MPRFPALLATLPCALALAALGFAACGTTSGSRAAEAPANTRPLRVRFVDWRSGQSLVLVDQSHTDRTKLYSSKRPLEEAGTKVTTDEVLEETLKFFREQGFFARAQSGAVTAGAGAVQSLEVETPDGIVHLDLGQNTGATDVKLFRQCRLNFAALYNSIYQLQSVDRAPDWEAQKKSLSGKPAEGRVP